METVHLWFRSLTPGDEAVTYPHINDELVQHWIGWEKPKNIKEEAERIEEVVRCMRQGLSMHFLAFDRDSGDFVGICGIETEHEETEVIIWIKKESQGRGYAKEMLQALISWAQQSTTLQYLVYSVTAGNAGSEALARWLNLQPFRTFTASKRGEERLVTDYKIVLLS